KSQTKENENYGEEELAALYHVEFPNVDASNAAAIKDPKSQGKFDHEMGMPKDTSRGQNFLLIYKTMTIRWTCGALVVCLLEWGVVVLIFHF
ncbi:hypothetical protein SOVF_013070, partial [Spinacia oleracea]